MWGLTWHIYLLYIYYVTYGRLLEWALMGESAVNLQSFAYSIVLICTFFAIILSTKNLPSCTTTNFKTKDRTKVKTEPERQAWVLQCLSFCTAYLENAMRVCVCLQGRIHTPSMPWGSSWLSLLADQRDLLSLPTPQCKWKGMRW